MATKLQPCLRIHNTWAGLSRSDRRSLASYAPFNRPEEPLNPVTARSKFPAAALSYYWDTLPPTPEQLNHASKFFKAQTPTFLWSADRFATMNFGNSPEVCFLGRSNVGKSSLLNALLCKRIANISAKPGRTRLMNAFAVGGKEDNGRNRLVVMDMPGYGKGGREEWGRQIMKYLEKRKQLKGTFVLIDSEHGVKKTDEQLLALIKALGIPYQIILSKADKIVYQSQGSPRTEAMDLQLSELRRTMESMKEWVQPNSEDDGGAVGEVIACSSTAWIDGKRMGIDAVRFAMLRAAGLEYRPSIPVGRQVDIIPHEEIFGIKHG
jgi:GTP-binding protein